MNEAYCMEPGLLDNDPLTFQEIINDKGAEHWQKAMKSEMNSMYFNQVWTLIDEPKDIKPSGCKWIDKKIIIIGPDERLGLIKRG